MTTIDGVLPIVAKDFERAQLLFESLALNFTGLGTLWLVCPDRDVEALTRCLAARPPAFRYQIEAESRVVPEFALSPRLGGWYRQQLIKLAVFERVESELYLTFDADVVCARRVDAADLLREGRGACYVIPEDLRPHWYERVGRVLRVEPRRGVMHNVTPALLHRRALGELAQHLNGNVARRVFSRGLRGLKQRWAFAKAERLGLLPTLAPWRLYLTAAVPWTEYALYYTFLETTGRFDSYHEYSEPCIYDIERSLWSAESASGSLVNWEPGAAFEGQGPPWFLVVQSNTGVSADAVRAKLAPLLRRAGA